MRHFVLTYVPGGFTDNENQEKRHQRVKKETNTSRFLGTFRKFGEEFKSVYESEPQAKVFSRITSTNKLSLISSSGYVSKQQSFFITNIPGS